MVEGAETVARAKSEYRFEIDSRVERGSPLSLRVAGEIGTHGGSVAVTVKVEDEIPDGSLVLRLVVTEDGVQYPGWYASQFDFVARDMLEDEILTLGAVGDSVVVERDFSIDQSWTSSNIDVVGFVQNDLTKEVIQSGRMGDGPADDGQAAPVK